MGIFDQIKRMVGGPDEEGDERRKQEPAGAEPRPEPARPETPLVIPETTPEALYTRLQAGEEIILLDVRMPWDYAAQHPAGATPLPLNELPERLEELDRSKHYVLSCYHGYSSQDGVAFLMEQGFERVESLQGGFSGWAQAGLPVESQ